ncbi:type II secretion system protein G (GspG) [Maricaulis salignorans]|uniref:Type II secretion system core protein G n=2 Tax=Maricaulis salignorans TaxID=144026 RepID=A0A1G9LZX6_9PROT|nr:type II secretion system protein G (GspG) [Maricaulis salignorans]
MKWFTDMTKPAPAARSSERGITLFELLVVLVILALLATIVAPRVIGYLGRSKTDVAQAQLSSIATSLELFYLDMGRYPDMDEGLEALMEAPEESVMWRGPYFGNSSGFNDPWGRPYLYLRVEPGDRFTLSTLGRDGEVGGEGEDGDLSRS